MKISLHTCSGCDCRLTKADLRANDDLDPTDPEDAAELLCRDCLEDEEDLADIPDDPRPFTGCRHNFCTEDLEQLERLSRRVREPEPARELQFDTTDEY